MNYLLDTSAFLWFILDSPQLPDRTRHIIADVHNEVYLSVVSVWEILVKHRLGKLPLPGKDHPASFIRAERMRHEIETLPLDEQAVAQIANIPDHHRDPFDRMLICQAISQGMVLVTPDRVINRYPVRTFWA